MEGRHEPAAQRHAVRRSELDISERERARRRDRGASMQLNEQEGPGGWDAEPEQERQDGGREDNLYQSDSHRCLRRPHDDLVHTGVVTYPAGRDHDRGRDLIRCRMVRGGSTA